MVDNRDLRLDREEFFIGPNNRVLKEIKVFFKDKEITQACTGLVFRGFIFTKE